MALFLPPCCQSCTERAVGLCGALQNHPHNTAPHCITVPVPDQGEKRNASHRVPLAPLTAASRGHRNQAGSGLEPGQGPAGMSGAGRVTGTDGCRWPCSHP